MTKERPILFSSPMVRAILDNRKTMTRRVIKKFELRYGEIGDLLWVKESFASLNGHVFYRADALPDRDRIMKYTSARYMPKAASRISLEISGVRVELLGEISEEDAKAEGVESVRNFKKLWDKINGKRPGCDFAASPWVFVISFVRVK